MTAPSLLDELEGVRARFDEWWFASKYMQVVYSPESTRQAALDGYIAAHADMAKRLEAAERDAARYQWLRNQAIAGVMTTPCHGSLNCDEPESEWDAWIDAAAQEGEG